jgi:hypothetical protein
MQLAMTGLAEICVRTTRLFLQDSEMTVNRQELGSPSFQLISIK